MRLTDPTLEPRPGYVYEPRALWGRMLRERIRIPSLASTVERFEPFGREDFYNSGKWPIVLTHMLVMSKPLEYATPYGFSPSQNVAPVYDAGDFSQPPAQKPTVRISKMGTAPFSLMDQIGALAWLGSTQSGPLSTAANSGGSFLDGFHTVRWNLDLPLTVPNRGLVQFDLSGRPPLYDVNVDPIVANPIGVNATAQFYEYATEPQQTPGNSRSNTSTLKVMSERDARHFTSEAAVAAVMGLSSGYAGIADPYVNGVSSTWDNGYGMPAREFIRRQAPSRRSSSLGALQFSFAKTTSTNRLSLMPQGSGTPRQLAAPTNLAHSIYTRAKVAQGGTNTWWWREGAPLALVMPTITPCPVYKFPVPVELNVGEGLSVSGAIPTDGLYPETFYDAVGPAPSTFYESHAYYVSVCGYACISTKR